MADAGIGLTEFPALTLAVIVGATAFVLVYISTLFKASARPEEVKSKVKEHTKTKEKTEGLHGGAPHNKSTKKKYVGERWGRDTKHTFSHPWLMTSLKGHSGRILDMDMSSNGKLLATCAEEDSEDPGGGEADGGVDLENGSSGDSSGSGGSGETSSSSSSCDASSSNSSLCTLSSSSSSKNSTEDGACEGDSEVGVTDKVASRSALSRKQKRNRMRREDDSGNGSSPVAPVRSRRKARGRAPKSQMANGRAKQNNIMGGGCGGTAKSRSDCSGSNLKSSAMRLPILRQYAKLTLGDVELAALLRHYLLTPDQLLVLGYPVESALYPGRAIIYKDPSGSFFPDQGNVQPSEPTRPAHLFDVNAREFVPRSNIATVEENSWGIDYGAVRAEWNAGHGSVPLSGGSPRNSSAVDGGSTSSPEVSVSSEEGFDLGDLAPQEDEEDDEDLGGITVLSEEVKCVDYYEDGECVERIVSTTKEVRSASEEKRCVRCGRGFFVTNDGEYLTQERCVYHWGKLQKVVVNRAMPSANCKGRANQGLGPGAVARAEFGCCGGRRGSRGCSVGRLHVWCGTGDGVNGPFGGYVKTQPQGKRVSSASSVSALVYALDCEMCFTGRGLELSKVTLVGIDGRPVYEALVRPGRPVVDHNTRFSGVTAGDLSRATKSLADVQKDLLALIHADTILVGHGLENDLRALRLIHGCVVDTAVVFPHYYGLPYRRSLRSLTALYLGREIQGSSSGHDSCEDARAAMEVMLWKVRRDFRSVLEN